MRRGWVVLCLLPALALAAGCGGEETTDPAPDGGGQPDTPPAVTANVETVSLVGLMDVLEPDEPRGKPLLVNLWANWCPECVAEIPFLVALHEKLGDRADIIGVSMDFAENQKKHPDLAAAVAEVKAAVAKLGIPYPVHVADPEDGAPQGWYDYLEIKNEVPWTVLYDADGVRKGAHPTFESAEQALAWFEATLKAD